MLERHMQYGSEDDDLSTRDYQLLDMCSASRQKTFMRIFKR